MTILRILSALILTSLLAACGGAVVTEPSLQTVTAAATVSVGAPTRVTSEVVTNAPSGAPAAPAFATVATATMPAPDCAAEGCARLHIIDGNAEAWRIDAARRAAVEQMAQL